MMKKFFVTMAILSVVGIYLYAGYWDTHYTTQADVWVKNGDDVILIDGAGCTWELTDRKDLSIGQSVKVQFDNNFTDYTRTDDKIVKVKVLP